MNILYLSAHRPLPARSGGQVDILNRLQALQRLGHRVHLVVTVRETVSPFEREQLSGLADRLTLVRRRPLWAGLLSRRPVQMAVRSGLRTVGLGGKHYDLLLLDSEFPAEILHNRSFSAARVAVRVHNDEAAYQRKLGNAARNPALRLFHRMEARRMAQYVPGLWRRADALWFISSDELQRFHGWRANETHTAVRGALLPAALDLRLVGQPALGNPQVLFVGCLAVTLNQDALRWYLLHVHPLLLPIPEYRLVIAGSTLGRDLAAFRAELQGFSRVELHCDVPDLEPLFKSSSVFVSPMRHGAGVKLKTVEAVLRGLPLVSTTVGAEGSGLTDGVHCHIADSPEAFASMVQAALSDTAAAGSMRDRAKVHVLERYDHMRELDSLLRDLTGS